jgi:hypothetical protein
MSKDPRKEAMKKAWKQQEQQKLVASLPMPHQDLRDLFDISTARVRPSVTTRTERRLSFSRSVD